MAGLQQGLGPSPVLERKPSRRPGRDLHAPPDPAQQQIQPGEGVIHPEPAAHQLGDPAASSTDPASPRRPGPRPAPPPRTAPARGACPSPGRNSPSPLAPKQ